MAAPTIAQKYVANQDADVSNISVSLSGHSVGDLIIMWIATDENPSASYAVTGLSDMSVAYIDSSVGPGAASCGCWYKVLVPGDELITSLGVSWTGNQGVCFWAYRIAAGDHDGISGTPASLDWFGDTTPDIPAIADLDDGENLVFAHCASDSIIAIVADPSGYSIENSDDSVGAGASSQFVWSDVLGGAQAAQTFQVNFGNNMITGIIAVKEAVAAGGGNTRPGCLRLGIRIGL